MGTLIVLIIFVIIFSSLIANSDEEVTSPDTSTSNNQIDLEDLRLKKKSNGILKNFVSYDYVEELIIKLLLIISDADEKYNESEIDFVSEYIDEILKSEKYGSTYFLAKSLNKTKNTFIENSKKNNQSISGIKNSILKQLKQDLDKKQKMELMELCLRMIIVDSEVTKEEFEIADIISDKIGIGIEDDLYLELKDKYLLKLNSEVIFSGDSIEQQVGIPQNLGEKEKRKYILGQYKKWNARMSVITDKEEKAKVQKMLDLLSEAMKNYK